MSAVQTELRVSYSVGYKVNMGGYESADVHLSESAGFDVTELDADAIQALSDATYEALKDKLDQLLYDNVVELKPSKA